MIYGTAFFWIVLLSTPAAEFPGAWAFPHPTPCEAYRLILIDWARVHAPDAQISPCNPVKVVDSEWEIRPAKELAR